jgi:hypothetical protein
MVSELDCITNPFFISFTIFLNLLCFIIFGRKSKWNSNCYKDQWKNARRALPFFRWYDNSSLANRFLKFRDKLVVSSSRVEISRHFLSHYRVPLRVLRTSKLLLTIPSNCFLSWNRRAADVGNTGDGLCLSVSRVSVLTSALAC